MNVIDRFYIKEDGGHTPLSNFSQHGFYIDGVWWPTNEHWFQANKTLDPQERELIRSSALPSRAKERGREVFLRPDWDVVKIPVMRMGLEAKFTHDSEAGQYLLATGDALLIEGNDWGDRFWGQVNGVGENWLGILLMARRAELRAALTL